MTEFSQKVDEMLKLHENKTCFDCGEKGVSYTTQFGTFICSSCAGLLRDLGFRVYGIGMSVFKEKDVENL